jgi:hypothetical protein
MSEKRYRPDEIIGKLRVDNILIGNGKILIVK